MSRGPLLAGLLYLTLGRCFGSPFQDWFEKAKGLDETEHETRAVYFAKAIGAWGEDDGKMRLGAAQTNLGAELMLMGKLEEAIRFLNQAIETVPEVYFPYSQRAAAHLALHRYQKAIDDAQNSLRYGSKSGSPHSTLCSGYQFLANPKAALRHCETAVQLSRGKASDLVKRGYAYADLGQFESAHQDFQRAIEGAEGGRLVTARQYGVPYIVEPRTAMGYLHFKKGEARQALEYYQLALRDAPRLEMAFWRRSRLWAAAQKPGQALSDLDEAVALDPEFAAAYHERATLHEGQGRLSQAHTDYELACRKEYAPACAALKRLKGRHPADGIP